MTEIKRYGHDHFGELVPMAGGYVVYFDDHAATVAERDASISALQEQVRALAAENCIQDFIISAVKELVSQSEGVTGWHLNGDVATWEEVLPEINHSETPATDASIREIRAQAVERVADSGEFSMWVQQGLKVWANRFRAEGEQP